MYSLLSNTAGSALFVWSLFSLHTLYFQRSYKRAEHQLIFHANKQMGQQLSINSWLWTVNTSAWAARISQQKKLKIKCNIRVSADSLDGSNMPHSFTYQTVHEDSVVTRERGRLFTFMHLADAFIQSYIFFYYQYVVMSDLSRSSKLR